MPRRKNMSYNMCQINQISVILRCRLISHTNVSLLLIETMMIVITSIPISKNIIYMKVLEIYSRCRYMRRRKSILDLSNKSNE